MKNLLFLIVNIFRITNILACMMFVSQASHALLHHGSVNATMAFVTTLSAALLIWMPNRDMRGATWTALFVLALGTALVALTSLAWSFAAFRPSLPQSSGCGACISVTPPQGSSSRDAPQFCTTAAGCTL
jgi:hypothetical protein